jgi:hypothetical protein
MYVLIKFIDLLTDQNEFLMYFIMNFLYFLYLAQIIIDHHFLIYFYLRYIKIYEL